TNIDQAPGVIPTPNLSCPIDTIRGTGAREFSGLGVEPASKSPAKPKSTKPVKAVTSKRKVVKVQPRAVQADQTMTTSGSNGHLIDQAVHTLVEERLFKKKGH